MNAMDKFLNALKMNDGDQDEYDEYEDDYYEEEPPKKSRSYQRDNYDSVDKPKKGLAKISSIRQQPVRKDVGYNMEVKILKPATFNEATEVTDTLLNNQPVVLNLDGLDVEVAQRIMDFTSGSTYALRGRLQQISKYILIVTPSNIDVSGDFQDIVSGSLDVNGVR